VKLANITTGLMLMAMIQTAISSRSEKATNYFTTTVRESITTLS
jgi:hypothetical protein